MIQINALGNKILATDEGVEINEPSYRTNRDRALIQSAFNSGDYDLVPEIDQPPISPPRWTEFNVAMLSDPNWQAWTLPADLRNAMIAASINANLTSLENAYAIAKATVLPSAEAIEGWQTLADTYNIPIVF